MATSRRMRRPSSIAASSREEIMNLKTDFVLKVEENLNSFEMRMRAAGLRLLAGCSAVRVPVWDIDIAVFSHELGSPPYFDGHLVPVHIVKKQLKNV